MSLSLIADSLDPVASNRLSWASSRVNPSFGEQFLPTHTFDTAPPLDVLIVPGGIGTRAPSPILNSTIAFVKDRFPTLQYFLTVCTGAGIAARAGVLDGKYATTNKRAWAETTALGPNVKWVPEARWVTDGNVWTSSGVSAGIDLMIAFIGKVWGNSTAVDIANVMEYVRHPVSTDDPFAGLYNLTDARNGTSQPSR
jgi:transcriptional regulator GlxA family with amidase domain